MFMTCSSVCHALANAAHTYSQGTTETAAAGRWGPVTTAVKGLLAKAGTGSDVVAPGQQPAGRQATDVLRATQGLHATFSLPNPARSASENLL